MKLEERCTNQLVDGKRCVNILGHTGACSFQQSAAPSEPSVPAHDEAEACDLCGSTEEVDPMFGICRNAIECGERVAARPMQVNFRRKPGGGREKLAPGDTEAEMKFQLFTASEGVREVMRFAANGDIYVHGKLVENDREVVAAMRNWLTACKFIAPMTVPEASRRLCHYIANSVVDANQLDDDVREALDILRIFVAGCEWVPRQ